MSATRGRSDSRGFGCLVGGILGAAALILALVGGGFWFAYRQLERGAGPQELALRQAIIERDVAAARAAIAAGANLDAAVPVDEASGDWISTTWLVVEEMGGRSGLPGRGSRRDPALLEIAAAMFAAGANPNSEVPPTLRTGRGSSTRARGLIEEAVFADSPELIDLMLKAGLNVKSVVTGEALVLACNGEHDDVAASLIRAGANVNYRVFSSGRTPLSEAVHHRRHALIALLEERGALEWGTPPAS
jgi:hypothetical protein